MSRSGLNKDAATKLMMVSQKVYFAHLGKGFGRLQNACYGFVTFQLKGLL